MESALTRSQLNRWRLAIFTIFVMSGLSVATWASRLPSIKLALGVDNAQIGTLLLALGVSSVTGVSIAPALLARIGAKRGLFLTMMTFAVGLLVIGVGATWAQSSLVVFLGLALFGLGDRKSVV